jgi:acyl dehydratase
MPLDPSFIGRTYPPTDPYEVGREKIREFADAIGDPNPAYRDAETAKALGYADVVAPPTFPIVLSMAAGDQVVEDPELGLDFSRVVHGDQRFTYTRPVVAGDRLVATVTITDIKTVAGNDLITSRADLVTENGEPVVVVHMMLAVRGQS